MAGNGNDGQNSDDLSQGTGINLPKLVLRPTVREKSPPPPPPLINSRSLPPPLLRTTLRSPPPLLRTTSRSPPPPPPLLRMPSTSSSSSPPKLQPQEQPNAQKRSRPISELPSSKRPLSLADIPLPVSVSDLPLPSSSPPSLPSDLSPAPESELDRDDPWTAGGAAGPGPISPAPESELDCDDLWTQDIATALDSLPPSDLPPPPESELDRDDPWTSRGAAGPGSIPPAPESELDRGDRWKDGAATVIRRGQALFESEAKEQRENPVFKVQMDAQYGSTEEQLIEIGREVVWIEKNGDCMFTAISDQLDDVTLTPNCLRVMIAAEARKSKDFFLPFLEEHMAKKWDFLMEAISKPGIWNTAIIDMGPLLFNRVLKRQIVVIREGTRHYFYPDYPEVITDESIVIVHSENVNHFDSSKKRTANPAVYPMSDTYRIMLTKMNQSEDVPKRVPKAKSAKKPCGSIKSQLREMNRKKSTVMPRDGNSFFKSLSQSASLNMDTLEARRFTADMVLEKKKKFTKKYYNGDKKKAKEILLLSEDGYWSDTKDLELMLIEALDTILGEHVFLVQEGKAPICFTSKALIPHRDNVVIIKDPADNFFHAANSKDKTQSDVMEFEAEGVKMSDVIAKQMETTSNVMIKKEPVEEEMNLGSDEEKEIEAISVALTKLNLETVPVFPQDKNSFFRALAETSKTAQTHAQLLRTVAAALMATNLENLVPEYFKSMKRAKKAQTNLCNPDYWEDSKVKVVMHLLGTILPNPIHVITSDTSAEELSALPAAKTVLVKCGDGKYYATRNAEPVKKGLLAEQDDMSSSGSSSSSSSCSSTTSSSSDSSLSEPPPKAKSLRKSPVRDPSGSSRRSSGKASDSPRKSPVDGGTVAAEPSGPPTLLDRCLVCPKLLPANIHPNALLSWIFMKEAQRLRDEEIKNGTYQFSTPDKDIPEDTSDDEDAEPEESSSEEESMEQD